MKKRLLRPVALLLTLLLTLTACSAADVIEVGELVGDIIAAVDEGDASSGAAISAVGSEVTTDPAEDPDTPVSNTDESQTASEEIPDVPETDPESPIQSEPPSMGEDPGETLPEDGEYTSKNDVALYIYLYGHLPDNFITKKEAQALGWSGGSLEKYAKGKSIGGDRFGNHEGLLPKKKGRTYTECDIDTKGAKSRGAKRIVFSNDGLVYYTEDHYESFELLYGEE